VPFTPSTQRFGSGQPTDERWSLRQAATVGKTSQVLWPFLPRVENGDDLGMVRSISVGNDVRYAWHDKFPGASDAGKTAEIGPFSEEVDGVKQRAGDSIGGLGLSRPNLRAKVSQVFDRARRSDDDHARGTFRPRLWPHERSHLATALCGTPRPSSRSVSPF
jgi:hypothetical protein